MLALIGENSPHGLHRTDVILQVLTLASQGRRIFKVDVERQETGLGFGLCVGPVQNMPPMSVQVGPPPVTPVMYTPSAASLLFLASACT